MRDPVAIHPDVLAVAVALAGNPEALKQATRVIQAECFIRTDPAQKIAEWSLAIVRELHKGQMTL
jgi:hypothetical protein